jgi:glycosyltransferase involved in cell wall biosynthesis
MQKITFVIPSRNNLEFLKLAYQSIRNLETRHEILILDDASTDGTSEWITELNDSDIMHYHNPGPERVGIVGMFDKGIAMARTNIIMAFHADMIACKDLDKNILKHLKPLTVVSATRVEPPLHPPGPEKLTVNFGIEAEEFSFENWYQASEDLKQDKTTEGIFAPWCMYKEDFLAIGGHDELFAPQSKEDSDLFNRFVLNSYQILQSWDGLVYHFTSRGSRFNKHAGGGAGKNSEEWLYTTTKNMRNFIRKWGTPVKHDALMKPIITPKYNIAFVINNCNLFLLQALEPWCDRIYVDEVLPDGRIEDYIKVEQANTNLDLQKRVLVASKNDPSSENDIIVKFNANNVTQDKFEILSQLPNIIQESGEVGTFELDIFTVEIKAMTQNQHSLINTFTYE